MTGQLQAPEAILRLLGAMERIRASDLFLTTGKVPAVRVDGRLRLLDAPATTASDLDALIAAVLPPSAQARFRAEGDLDAGITIEGDRRYRLNFSREQGRVTVVARALPSGELSFADLGLPEGVASLAEHPNGLVLVAGATGSGKSTTLAAMVHHINRTRPAHVVTIEDPIEFVHREIRARITQREVGIDTASFHRALRSVVRQSPDVIVIGEMRDRETIEVALAAALTGHLVLTSLHTVDAVQTLQRILAYFPEHQRDQVSVDLALALRGVIAQRLLPRADGEGRVVAVELLTGTPAASRLLRERRVEELTDLMRAHSSEGMATFNEALLALYQAGKISYEVGLAYASNREEFALWAKGMSVGVDGFRTGGPDAVGTGLDMKALLELVVERGASDLHLGAGRPPTLRVGGELQPVWDAPLSDADMRMLLFSVMTARRREQFELEREADFALALDDGRRFRINAYFQRGRMAAALRAIPSEIPDAGLLRIPPVVLELGSRPQGLLLVVGPTGSGKSTTLACLVDRINRSRTCRIITIEDPIEYVHISDRATVDQRELYADTKSFAAALKFVLRQDPDVILVGEMRDPETIAAALTAAETGHLVLSTLHANDAVQAVDRIVDAFPSHQQDQVRSQLAACLLGVVSQRLLPLAGQPSDAGPERIAAFEVMVATSGIRTLIREQKMHQAYGQMEVSQKEGCVTMDQALAQLYAQNLITREDARRYLRNPRALEQLAAEDPPAAPEPSRGRLPWWKGS